MLEPDAAARRIVDSIAPLPAIDVALTEADGLVLSADVVSPISMPVWSNSAMDGYACRADDVKPAAANKPVRLAVVGAVRAGAFATRGVERGEAIRIATGAPIPEGADTVVRIEDTDGGSEFVQVRDARDAGRNVRPAGEDVRTGAVVARAGEALGPGQIALLASVGAATVRVHRRARVAIVTTGDELVDLDGFAEVKAGRRIVSSNSYGLIAAIRSAGAEPVNIGIVRDDPAALSAALERASSCDLVVTSAGVSVGEADHLRSLVESLGGAVDFWRVRMRPGSPLAFGSIRGKPWLGLPGNPVSTMVTFELFGRPAIRRLMGHRTLFPLRVPVTVDEPTTAGGTLTHYLRVRVVRGADGALHATFTGPQASNILSSVARADALLVVPPSNDGVRPGDVLDAIMLRAPGESVL